MRGAKGVPVHRNEMLLLMSVQGHQLPLGAGIACGRFIPKSGRYLKLIDWPKGANSRLEQVQQKAFS